MQNPKPEAEHSSVDAMNEGFHEGFEDQFGRTPQISVAKSTLAQGGKRSFRVRQGETSKKMHHDRPVEVRAFYVYLPLSRAPAARSGSGETL